jgi:hypothetical protein
LALADLLLSPKISLELCLDIFTDNEAGFGEIGSGHHHNSKHRANTGASSTHMLLCGLIKFYSVFNVQ